MHDRGTTSSFFPELCVSLTLLHPPLTFLTLSALSEFTRQGLREVKVRVRQAQHQLDHRTLGCHHGTALRAELQSQGPSFIQLGVQLPALALTREVYLHPLLALGPQPRRSGTSGNHLKGTG